MDDQRKRRGEEKTGKGKAAARQRQRIVSSSGGLRRK